MRFRIAGRRAASAMVAHGGVPLALIGAQPARSPASFQRGDRHRWGTVPGRSVVQP